MSPKIASSFLWSILYIEGNLLAQKTIDFDTVPDKTGRRWVDSFNIFGDRQTWPAMVKKAKLGWEIIEREMDEIGKKYYDRWMLPGDDPNNLSYEEYKELAKKEQGPLIAKMIKDYIDLANKAFCKKNIINIILIKHLIIICN